MKKKEWQLRRYYWQIRSWLPCTWRQKNRFIRELSGNVRAFLKRSLDADMDAVRERFGTPQQIAAAFVDETDTSTLLKGLQIRRRVFAIALAVAIIGLITFALLYAHGVQTIDETFGGYIVEEIEIMQ